jgi:hypothetical protein
MRSGQETDKICHFCGFPVKYRNLSGYCDHLYYPDNLPKEAKSTFWFNIYKLRQEIKKLLFPL